MHSTRRRDLLLLTSASWLATGCAPHYNWREVRDDRGNVALLPARPQHAVRPLPLLGETIRFSLISTEVDEDLFAFGSAVLPDRLAAAADAPRVIDRFQEVLLAQTRTTLERSGVAPDRAWTLGRLAPPVASREIEARLGSRRLIARFYVDRGLFIEQAAWFDESRLPRADLATFLDGLQPG